MVGRIVSTFAANVSHFLATFWAEISEVGGRRFFTGFWWTTVAVLSRH
jgi:hypothetical protein